MPGQVNSPQTTAVVIGSGATGGPLYLTKNAAGAPPYSFAGDTNTGIDSYAADTLDLVIAGASSLKLSDDTLLVGGVASATPDAQTFTLGEDSRSGTDSNVGGSSGTLRSGLGTGTGTASSLIFQTPTVAASGTDAQSYTTRLTITAASITSTVALFDCGNNRIAANNIYLNSAVVLDGLTSGADHIVRVGFSGTNDGIVDATSYRSGNTKVVGAQGAAVADAGGGAVAQVASGATECVDKINLILARLRAHGLIAS